MQTHSYDTVNYDNNYGGGVSAVGSYSASNYTTGSVNDLQQAPSYEPYATPQQEDIKKPDSFNFGVSAQRQEEPLRQEKLYSEEDEWQPSAMMLCFMCWIVLVVAGGVAVSIFFANKNLGKNRPTIGPSLAPSAMPTMVPSTVPPESVCFLCGEQDSQVTEPLEVVEIPGLGGDFACTNLQTEGLQGNIPQSVCTEQVQQPSVQNACGCTMAPTVTPSTNSSSTAPTNQGFITPAPNFVCPICGSPDTNITNPDGVLEFPGTGEAVTCQQVLDRANDGQIDPNICYAGALSNAVLLNCECIYQCDLCGSQDGAIGEITNPEGIVQLPLGQPERTCASLLELAQAGEISDAQCSLFQQFVVDPCECVYAINVL